MNFKILAAYLTMRA